MADRALDATRDLQRAGRDPDNSRPSREEEKKRPSKAERRAARLEMAERVMRAGMSLYEQMVEAERPSSSAESQSQGVNIPAEDDLSVFEDPNYHWAGGVRDPRLLSDIDMYIPQDEEHIVKMLIPLETAMKKLCYVPKDSKPAKMIANRLVARRKPVSVRYLKMIEDSVIWTRVLNDLPLRFEQHFDAEGLRLLMSYPQPERILWNHLEFMRAHKGEMRDVKSHRRLMTFDENSRVETFTEFPQWQIDGHIFRYGLDQKGYVGVSRAELRRAEYNVARLNRELGIGEASSSESSESSE
jgi:hypothetical protein